MFWSLPEMTWLDAGISRAHTGTGKQMPAGPPQAGTGEAVLWPRKNWSIANHLCKAGTQGCGFEVLFAFMFPSFVWITRNSSVSITERESKHLIPPNASKWGACQTCSSPFLIPRTYTLLQSGSYKWGTLTKSRNEV